MSLHYFTTEFRLAVSPRMVLLLSVDYSPDEQSRGIVIEEVDCVALIMPEGTVHFSTDKERYISEAIAAMAQIKFSERLYAVCQEDLAKHHKAQDETAN